MTHTLDIKVAVAQMRPMISAIRHNVDCILKQIREAHIGGADIIVFPELATSGYVLGDRWEQEALIREIEALDEEIRAASMGIIVVWGSVKVDWQKIGEDGRVRKYNVARIAANGTWVSNGLLDGWIPKTNLPKYRIFDDARHFYTSANLAAEMGCKVDELLRVFSVQCRGKNLSLALTICEDLWEDEYLTKPSRIYGAQCPDLLIDISASPWTAGKCMARDRMLVRRVQDSGLPILYVNAVGLENNTKNLIWFDGDSAFVNTEGAIIWRAPQHSSGLFYAELAGTQQVVPERLSGVAEIHGALVSAMREFFGPFNRVVIGLSGGIDSAVSAALLVEALGPEKVLAVNMPTMFNSTTTQRLAAQCAGNLGIEYHVVPIQQLLDTHCAALTTAGFTYPEGLVLENIQARIRGAGIQATLAQMEGGVFVCNGNKTEVALNYFTLYGDGAGAAAFLADLWKGQVYELARFLNQRAGQELIPEGILTLVPSAELSEEQNVEEGKGDPIFYPYHDKLLRAFTERRWDPTTVLAYAIANDLEAQLGCEPGTLGAFFSTRAAFVENLEWAWECYSVEFKRAQTPPVFLASRRAFGFDRRDTISAGYLTEEYRTLKARYLSA